MRATRYLLLIVVAAAAGCGKRHEACDAACRATLTASAERLVAACPELGAVAKAHRSFAAGIAAKWAKATTVDARRVHELDVCSRVATTCKAQRLCAQLIAPPAAIPAQAVAQPAPLGVVMQPGDSNACVTCAMTHCQSVAAPCLTDARTDRACSAEGGCCASYRRCVSECAAADRADDGRAALCTFERCDARLPTGRRQFQAMQACMRERCAGCGG